jgi:adenosylmethionine-8-amino-7-oxononanoate aminotransferase
MDQNFPDPTPNSLEEHWMPFSANREFKAEPRLVVKSEGCYHWDHKCRAGMAARRLPTRFISSC